MLKVLFLQKKTRARQPAQGLRPKSQPAHQAGPAAPQAARGLLPRSPRPLFPRSLSPTAAASGARSLGHPQPPADHGMTTPRALPNPAAEAPGVELIPLLPDALSSPIKSPRSPLSIQSTCTPPRPLHRLPSLRGSRRPKLRRRSLPSSIRPPRPCSSSPRYCPSPCASG